MRIRNRSTHLSSPFLPSPPPSNAHNNLPNRTSLEPSPAPGGISAGVAEGVALSEGGSGTRESSRGTHPPAQIECFLARSRRGGKGARRPSLGSSVGDGDGGKVVVSRSVEVEAWQDGARKLSARSGKNEGASNGGLKEELVSRQDSKGRRRREEGEKAPGPVKKRKRDIDREWKIEDDELLATKKNLKRKQRGNTAGKEQTPPVEHEDKEEDQDASDTDTTSAGKHRRISGKNGSNKTKTAGHVFIEGSRCSRINGRGWRCSQQTLVGYSLCEHHLGKGRLKSMSSLRGRQSAASRIPHTDMINENNHMSLESPLENVGDDQKPLIEAMKGHARKNIGSVKARSMSSLLGVNIAHGSSTSDIGGVAAGIDASNSESGASPIPG